MSAAVPQRPSAELPLCTVDSGVLIGHSALVRLQSRLLSLASAVSLSGLVIGGCTGEKESSATTTILPYVPLVGVRDGDRREAFVGLFCGADYLPVSVNDMLWRAEEVHGDDIFWVPAEWAAVAATIDDTSDMLMVQIQMESNGSRVIATANGRSVAYRPATPDDPANECY